MDPPNLAAFAEFDRVAPKLPKGKGFHLSKYQRRQIYRAQEVKKAKTIHIEYFEAGNFPLCSAGRIRNILAQELGDPDRYLRGPFKRTGRRRAHLIRGSLEVEVLLDLFSVGEYRSLWKLTCDFRRLYYENPDDSPSYSSVVRFFHLHRYSRMVMERRHILRNEDHRLAFMDDVAHREVASLIFCDETLTTNKEYFEKYGWGLIGEKCMKTQFVLCGEHFSVFALYCQDGFLAWKILKGDNTAECFQDFMEECRDRDPPR